MILNDYRESVDREHTERMKKDAEDAWDERVSKIKWNALLTLNFHNKTLPEHQMIERLLACEKQINILLGGGHSNRVNRQRLHIQFIARPEISPEGEKHFHMLVYISEQVWNRLFEKCVELPEGYRVRLKVRDIIARICKRESILHLDKKDPTLDDAKRYGFYTKKKWKDNDFEEKNVGSKGVFKNKMLLSL